MTPPGSPIVTSPPPSEEPQLISFDSEQDPFEDTPTQMHVSPIVSLAESDPVREDSPDPSIDPPFLTRADTRHVPKHVSTDLVSDRDFEFE